MELDKFKTMMNVRERMTYREQTSQKILYYPLLLHEKENSK